MLGRSNLFPIDYNSAVDLSCIVLSELTCPLIEQSIGSGSDQPSIRDYFSRLYSISADWCDAVDLSCVTLSLLS